MDLYHNPGFVFENPYVFSDRYAAEPDYFNLDDRIERNPVVSIQKGGALLEYEDEDPRVRRDFEEALRAEGIACEMPTFA
jgi:hypothetical protein